MTPALGGILAPVVTPFGADGAPSREMLARNVRAHLAAGVHGIVIAGSTGEAALLDASERVALVEWARELVPPDRLLIAGVGAESTRGTVALARDAARAGADAVLVVAPHYYGSSAMTAPALSAHYRAVADASPAPVVLYNIPRYMHFSLAPGLVADLSLHANVVGIKDSSGDATLLSTYLNVESRQFAVLTGSAALLATALEMGARGGILAAATFAPAVALEVWNASAARDAARVRAAQDRLTPLGQRIVGEMGVPGVKAAHDAVGLAGGAPRPPLMPAEDGQRGLVARLLAQAGVAVS